MPTTALDATVITELNHLTRILRTNLPELSKPASDSTFKAYVRKLLGSHELEAKNNGGRTALLQAAFTGAVNAVKLLLDRGASYTEDNNGDTAYDLACAAKDAKPENKKPIQELLRPLQEEHLRTKDAAR